MQSRGGILEEGANDMTSADLDLLIVFLKSDEFAEDPNHEENPSLINCCRYCRRDLQRDVHDVDCRIWTARSVLCDVQEHLFPRPDGSQY
jgi:hypothetical protein